MKKSIPAVYVGTFHRVEYTSSLKALENCDSGFAWLRKDGRIHSINIKIKGTGIGTRNLYVHLEEEIPEHEPSWLWDGNEERPTLGPSIDCIDGNTGESLWHGYLENGHFREV